MCGKSVCVGGAHVCVWVRVILFYCEIEGGLGHKSKRLIYFKETRPPVPIIYVTVMS